MRDYNARRYPLHYQRVIDLHRQGMPEIQIAKQLRLGVLMVRQWIEGVQGRRVMVFKEGRRRRKGGTRWDG